MHKRAHCRDEAANHQLPIAAASSFPGGKFKLNTKFDADLLFYSRSHFECDGHTVHMLTQWHLLPPVISTVNHHCSHMHFPVYSPWLPGYINVTQTILDILTWQGFLWTDLPYKPKAMQWHSWA